MTNSIPDTSLRQAALVAGFGLLIMTLAYLLPEIFVFKALIVSGDAEATANNILANEMLFRMGICGFLIVILCDVLVAWAFYVFLRPVSRSLSLLAAWFRLVYSVTFVIALFNYLDVLRYLSGAKYLSVFDLDNLHAQVMLSINAFSNEWAMGFVFFGLHLALVGYLAFKANYIPKFLGILLMVAGLSYLIDTFSKFLFPDFNVVLSVFTGWGELLFAFWLLYKGIKYRSFFEF
ncbi:DUF4386 domain-containing protein [Nitrospirota bacterium]